MSPWLGPPSRNAPSRRQFFAGSTRSRTVALLRAEAMHLLPKDSTFEDVHSWFF
jgi:hypothetical protein